MVHRTETAAAVVVNADGSVVRTASSISTTVTTLASHSNIIKTVRDSLSETRANGDLDNLVPLRQTVGGTSIRLSAAHANRNTPPTRAPTTLLRRHTPTRLMDKELVDRSSSWWSSVSNEGCPHEPNKPHTHKTDGATTPPFRTHEIPYCGSSSSPTT